MQPKLKVTACMKFFLMHCDACLQGSSCAQGFLWVMCLIPSVLIKRATVVYKTVQGAQLDGKTEKFPSNSRFFLKRRPPDEHCNENSLETQDLSEVIRKKLFCKTSVLRESDAKLHMVYTRQPSVCKLCNIWTLFTNNWIMFSSAKCSFFLCVLIVL